MPKQGGTALCLRHALEVIPCNCVARQGQASGYRPGLLSHRQPTAHLHGLTSSQWQTIVWSRLNVITTTVQDLRESTSTLAHRKQVRGNSADRPSELRQTLLQGTPGTQGQAKNIKLKEVSERGFHSFHKGGNLVWGDECTNAAREAAAQWW